MREMCFLNHLPGNEKKGELEWLIRPIKHNSQKYFIDNFDSDKKVTAHLIEWGVKEGDEKKITIVGSINMDIVV